MNFQKREALTVGLQHLEQKKSQETFKTKKRKKHAELQNGEKEEEKSTGEDKRRARKKSIADIDRIMAWGWK